MDLDIIIPAHNEQHRIDATLTAYRTQCPAGGVRLLVALDDCTDRTHEIVARHRDADERVEMITYPRLGKGGVIAETLRRSGSDYVAFVDADGATPPAELLRLVQACDETGADLAIASRYHPAAVLPAARGRGRKAAGLVFALLVRRLFKLPYCDTQCGAKVLRRSAAERLAPLLSSRDFVFDVELLHLARLLDYRVAEVPTVWIDRDGSRLRAGRDSVRMAASLAVLWLRSRVVPVSLPAAEVVEIDDPARNQEAAHAA